MMTIEELISWLEAVQDVDPENEDDLYDTISDVEELLEPLGLVLIRDETHQCYSVAVKGHFRLGRAG